MAYGEGARRNCPRCGGQINSDDDNISHREIRGPRNITSSNWDRDGSKRVFDDRFKRFLVVEEKHQNEPPMSKGQKDHLIALSKEKNFTVWFCKGTVNKLSIWDMATRECLIKDGDLNNYQEVVMDWFVKI